MEIREIEVVVFKKVGVDEDTYCLLREQKRIQKKSMIRIVKNLVLNKYGRKTNIN